MMNPLPLALFCLLSLTCGEASPIRVLFLGHDGTGPGQGAHQPHLRFPILQQVLGPEAIYFDYHSSPKTAFRDPRYLQKFDAVLIYANHREIERKHWNHLLAFIENGGGFVPVHCASWCFQNIPEYEQVLGARFRSHRAGIFQARNLQSENLSPEMKLLPTFEAWDETYYHRHHQEDDRIVIQVRDPLAEDPHSDPEPWTWIRQQGNGRVFYTASGHDERTWSLPEFHQLLKMGILWSVGEERKASYQTFLDQRVPLRYESRPTIPNYEKRPQPPLFQLPLSPEDSLSYTKAPVGFHLQLFAAEPDIINPMELAWDHRGRLWTIETVDYPNEVREGQRGDDSIKILEDTDGDGLCDKVTVFATGLNIPTSLTPYRDGVIIHHPPHTVFLRDTNGDDRCDTEEVLFTGWGLNDTHAGPANLRWGPDNHVWGTVGYAAYRHKGKDFRMGIYRFRPDGSDLEFLHQFNNNTWGLGFNAAGDVFGSTANRNPSFFGGIPATAYPPGQTPVLTARMIAPSERIHPITPNIRQVDVWGGYTAAAGHAFALSDAFPQAWQDQRAFVCAPTGNLVGAFDIRRDGAGYLAENAFDVIASADEWFSPVAAEIGPDGHLWIADWYNFIIQHNPTPNPNRGGYYAERGSGNAHINPLRDRSHGRIYRLIWEDARPAPAPTSLETSDALLNALRHPNYFWRTTARRLLFEQELVTPMPVLSPTTPDTVQAAADLGPFPIQALTAKDPTVRRAAVRALPETAEGADLLFGTALLDDPDLTTRLATFVKLASLPESSRIQQAATRLLAKPENAQDDWLRQALLCAGAEDEEMTQYQLGPNLLTNGSMEDLDAKGYPTGWLPHLYGGVAEFTIAETDPGSAEGTRSLQITSSAQDVAQGGADAGWRTSVAVTPHTRYHLSGRIRTAGVQGARGALLNVHAHPVPAKTQALQRNTPWTRVETTFDSQDKSRVTINALFGGWGRSTGTAFYDDIALRELIPSSTPNENETLVGNPRRGRDLFVNHAAAACVRCHALEGEGGQVGPALDHIAARKDGDYLRRSLLEPSADLAEGFTELGISPMPPMNLLLSNQEVEDLLAYLATLE